MPLKHFCCEHLCLCHQLLWPFDPLLQCSALSYCTCVLCDPRRTAAHPSVPGCHWTSLPCCHFCPCCQDKLACVSHCIPHVQCKKNWGTWVLFESRGTTLTFVVQPRGCLLGFLWKQSNWTSACSSDHDTVIQIKWFVALLAVWCRKICINYLFVFTANN